VTSQVLIYGSDHLAFRIAEQLLAEGCQVSVIAVPDSWLANAGLAGTTGSLPMAGFFCDQRTDMALLQAAAIEQMDALLAVTDRDEANLGLALAALELNLRLRIVLRQFNVRLGRLLEQHLPQCAVMSMSALAASTFALAAGSPGVRFAHHLGADTLVLREETMQEPQSRASLDPEHSRIVVAIEREAVVWFPSAERVFAADTRLLIASTDRGLPLYERPIRPSAPTRYQRSWRSYRILIGVMGYLALVVTCASLFFSRHLGMRLLDAVYFVITIITSVGFGDFSLREADALSKIVGIVLMVSGVGITATFFALVTNSLVAHQQAFEQGRVRQRISDHSIVCGLGIVGLRVAQSLQERGERVVCVEKNEDGRFVGEARRLGIPVVIGDALHEQTLRYANIANARSLIVCSNPDHLNLEIALNARSLSKDLPVVLRMFDPDLARRVARHFNLGTTFSSASLVAARFASQATDSTSLCNLHFHHLSLDFHQVNVAPGEDVMKIAKQKGGRLVGVLDSEGHLRFATDDDEGYPTSSIILVG